MAEREIGAFEPIVAMLRQDFSTYDRLLHDVEPREFVKALTAAFTVAADRRFGHGAGRAEIVAFVADVRSRLGDDEDAIDPGKAERVLRTVALGEDGLIDDVDELGQIESVLLLPLLDDTDGWDDHALDQFLKDARSVAAQWV